MTEYQKLTKAQLIEALERQQSELDRYKDDKLDHLRHDLEVHQIELEVQNRELRDKQQELEQAYDKYVDLYEFAPVGYLSLDRKAIIRDINLTATAQLRQNRQTVLNKPFSIFLANGNSGVFFHSLREVLDNGEKRSLELLLKSKDDTQLNVRLQMAPPRHADDLIRVAMIDISQQKQAEAQAREDRETLLHAGRLSLLGEISSGIAHEISQPVGAIGVYAETLNNMARSGQLSEAELVEIAEKLTMQAERAGMILKRIRSFSRRETPDQLSEDVVEVIRDAIGLVEPALEHNKVTVEIDEQDSLPRVTIDRLQIMQVLVNLFHNAIEAMTDMPGQERQITVEVGRADDEFVEIAIRDRGTGIHANGWEQLFTPFYTTRAEGLGLGLSLSHSIIQTHGGRLWAQPNTPQGTVFRFTLPVADQAVASAQDITAGSGVGPEADSAE